MKKMRELRSTYQAPITHHIGNQYIEMRNINGQFDSSATNPSTTVPVIILASKARETKYKKNYKNTIVDEI